MFRNRSFVFSYSGVGMESGEFEEAREEAYSIEKYYTNMFDN